MSILSTNVIVLAKKDKIMNFLIYLVLTTELFVEIRIFLEIPIHKREAFKYRAGILR
jgi:hypothetical protein